MIVRGRRQNHQDAMDDSDDSDASARRDAERRVRYQHCSLDEASDPDTWMEVRHHHDDESSSAVSASTDWGFPHNPTAAACVEAIDVTHGEVGNVAICNFLMERAGRRLRQATDGGADAVETLSNAFDRFESGELNDL